MGLAACSVCARASGVCAQLLERGGRLALQDAAVMQLSNSQISCNKSPGFILVLGQERKDSAFRICI